MTNGERRVQGLTTQQTRVIARQLEAEAQERARLELVQRRIVDDLLCEAADMGLYRPAYYAVRRMRSGRREALLGALMLASVGRGNS